MLAPKRPPLNWVTFGGAEVIARLGTDGSMFGCHDVCTLTAL